MNLTPVVEALALVPEFMGRVFYTIDREAGIDLVAKKPTPSCVVHGPNESAEPNYIAGMGGPAHRVTVAVSILTTARYFGEALGGKSFAELDAIRAKTMAAALGWMPTDQVMGEAWDPLEYEGGRAVFADTGTIVWQDDFITRYVVRKA